MARAATSEQRIEAVRRFNRFYTRRIGVLDEGLVGSAYSLTEARILFEVAARAETTASAIGGDLGLDAGYLSRTLSKLEQQRLIEKRPSDKDGRRRMLRLTDEGREAFASLNSRSRNQVEALLADCSSDEQERLVAAMGAIEQLMGSDSSQPVQLLLRPHQPGDMGWVMQRHGVLYYDEYGWDETFEALVATIVAEFIQNFDRNRERCWIAEKDGHKVGCVFCVKASASEAKLRLLLVEPGARGLGLGKHLVDECIRFAKRAGYEKLSLWTNDVLHAARHIYIKSGFELVKEESHHSFGHDLVGQFWQRSLDPLPNEAES